MSLQGNETTSSTAINNNLCLPVPIDSSLETCIVLTLFTLIFVVGVLGNGTLVFIFARHPRMRNVPNTYIISLALGDLLLILITIPYASIPYIFTSWPYTTAICKISETVRNMSAGLTVFSLTVLSIERYFVISNPIRYRIFSKSSTLLITVAIWLVATLLALPSTFLSRIHTATLCGGQQMNYCWPFPQQQNNWYRKSVVISSFLVYYVVPLCIIATFYGRMAWRLKMTTHNPPGEKQGQLTRIRARKKVAKAVVTFIVIFMICFLPNQVFTLWFHLSSHEEVTLFRNYFSIISVCLSFCHSCINPVALYFVSDTFREHFNRYLFVCLRPSSQSTEFKLNLYASNSRYQQGSLRSQSAREM